MKNEVIRVRLTNEQKLLIQEWVAAGKTNQQIIRLAAENDPPFVVKSANISKTFRKGSEKKEAVVLEERSAEAVSAGLAVKEERIRMLEETAQYMFHMMKRVPSDKMPQIVNAMRGCLDDIAKELGQRSSKVDVNANVRVKDITAIVRKVYGK